MATTVTEQIPTEILEDIPHDPGAVTRKNLERVQEYADLCAQKLGGTVSFN